MGQDSLSKSATGGRTDSEGFKLRAPMSEMCPYLDWRISAYRELEYASLRPVKAYSSRTGSQMRIRTDVGILPRSDWLLTFFRWL